MNIQLINLNKFLTVIRYYMWLSPSLCECIQYLQNTKIGVCSLLAFYVCLQNPAPGTHEHK